MDTLTWQINKEDFGFVGRLHHDVEYNIDDVGIKIIEKDQTKFYSWSELKFFWPNNLSSRHGVSGGLGFKNLMGDVDIIKNLPDEKIGETFWIYFKNPNLHNEKFSQFPLYAAGYNAKDVFAALKSRLSIWNNFLYIRVVGHTFGHLVFILGFFIPVYYTIYERWTPIFGLLSGVAALILLYRCVQDIRYFFKFHKQQWQKR